MVFYLKSTKSSGGGASKHITCSYVDVIVNNIITLDRLASGSIELKDGSETGLYGDQIDGYWSE